MLWGEHMKISAAIILDYLGDQVTRHNICPDFDPWIYCARHYYNGYNNFSEEEACIASGCDAFKIVEYGVAGLYIIADEKGTLSDFNPCKPYMICNCPDEKLFDEIMTCFMKWSVFEDKTKTVLLDRPSLKEFIEMSADFIKLPLTIIDDTMKFVCRSGNIYYEKLPDYAGSGQTMQVPYTLLDQLTKHKELNQILGHKETFVFVSEVMYSPIIISNFFHGDTYLGRISACDGREKYSLGLVDSVDYIRRHAQPILERHIFGSGFSHTHSEHIIRRILLGEITDSTIIHDTMESMGFQSGEPFVCLYFCLSETGLADNLMKHFVEMLKNRFKWPCVVPFMKDVVATFPQRKGFGNIQKLSAFLKDSNIKAGRSESFDDFSKLPYAFRQALDALKTGKSTGSSKMMYWYKDYAQLTIVKKLLATENIEVYYHPAVLFLNQYDTEHGTEYCKTLRFLSDYSGTQKQLADMLFIHRNTLQYRLDRLGELVKINLDDPEERFRIALTCRLMDVKQKPDN
jgi:hypothetical protein